MLYTRTINGKQEFSDCRVIQLDGIWISNPTAEQIALDGWVEYVPPQVEPTPMTEPDTYEIMEAVKKMLSSSVTDLSDEDALSVAALYPTWASKVGEQVNTGERYWYDGKLYKVVQQHTVQDDWTPDVSVSLFTEVTIEEWPEFVQPISSETAYMTGDKVTYNGQHYVSLIDNNVWSPEVTPQYWEAQP
jgi:hypothetical protein